MKVIKYNSALKGKNSDKCKTLEYSFMDKDIIILLAVAILVAAVIIILNIPKNKAKKNPVKFLSNSCNSGSNAIQ